MSEPIKLPPIPATLVQLGYGFLAEEYATDAVEQATADLHAEVEKLRAELARMVRRAGQSKAHRDEVGAELKRLTTLPCSAAHAPPPPPPPLWSKGCPVCGIGCQSGVYGVVCARGDCPTRVTCEVTK